MNNRLAAALPAIEPDAPARAPVIFLDDDADLRRANEQSLLLHGFDVRACASAREALAAITERYEGVVVADVRMPDIDGFQLFHRIRAIDADIPVILITGHGDIDMAVQAIREGVYDFVAKPYPLDRLIQAITHAGEKRRLILENRSLRVAAEGAADSGFHFIGTTPAMQRIKQTLRHIADADVDVLIQGETGAGKEVAAQALHRSSRRRDKPFVAINCGALPESIIESELFGHEAGAFTGAQKRRIGRIEHAHGGTLFLDEIESMPLAVQVKLLRVLETRQVAPLGTNDVRDVDLRVIAATKEDLAAPALRSRFREDLYYRLNVVTLHLPPLRERAADIPLLFAHHVAQASQRFHRSAPPVTAQVRRYIAQHAWPGNVRELAHFAERFVLEVLDAEITEAPAAGAAAGAFASLPLQLEKYEEKLIREALAATQGDVRQTLEILGIPRKTFYDKLQRHGIDRASYSV
jgi:two-component system C4-dicarboxylate transport response regulator DctD